MGSLLVGKGNIRGFLNGIAVAHPLRGYPQGLQLLQLEDGSNVEIGSQRRQTANHRFIGVRLYGVVNIGERKGPLQLRILLAQGWQIKEQARRGLIRRKLVYTLPGSTGQQIL